MFAAQPTREGIKYTVAERTWLSVFTCAPCVGMWQATELTGVYFGELPVCYLATACLHCRVCFSFLKEHHRSLCRSVNVYFSVRTNRERDQNTESEWETWIDFTVWWINRCVRGADRIAWLRGVGSLASATGLCPHHLFIDKLTLKSKPNHELDAKSTIYSMLFYACCFCGYIVACVCAISGTS